jgi:predicted phosphodiesterase
MVQGVSDKALATLDPGELHAMNDHERRMLERMREVRAELGDVILGRLRRLPTHLRIPLEDGGELLLVHGSPVDPAEALTFDMSDEEINAMIGDDPADVIVCGMSHVPFDRTVSGVRIVNVGSVGDAPDGGVTSSRGATRQPVVAHATWIDSTPSGIFVEQIRVPLDAGVERVLTIG